MVVFVFVPLSELLARSCSRFCVVTARGVALDLVSGRRGLGWSPFVGVIARLFISLRFAVVGVLFCLCWMQCIGICAK